MSEPISADDVRHLANEYHVTVVSDLPAPKGVIRSLRAAADRIEELERELAIVDAALSAACSDAWSDADGARRSYIDTARAEAAQ